MEDRAEWERQLRAELSFALRIGSKINLSDLPISLADVPDGKLIAEVLRRGDKLDLAGVLVSMPDDRLYRELSGRGPLRLNLSEIAEGELCRELDRRGKLPRMALSAVDDGELYGELGRRRQAKRKVHRGGTGRPRKPRCACGRWTVDAAGRKGHRCGAEPCDGSK